MEEKNGIRSARAAKIVAMLPVNSMFWALWYHGDGDEDKKPRWALCEREDSRVLVVAYDDEEGVVRSPGAYSFSEISDHWGPLYKIIPLTDDEAHGARALLKLKPDRLYITPPERQGVR